MKFDILKDNRKKIFRKLILGKTNGSTNDCTLPNGQKVQKALRKEIRLLTEEERNKFVNI